MKKQYFWHSAVFSVLTFLVILFTSENVNATNITDKITDKILFTSSCPSSLECVDYIKNGIHFYSVTKENFIDNISDYNLFYLSSNEQFLFSSDYVRLVNLDEENLYQDVYFNTYRSYKNYNFVFGAPYNRVNTSFYYSALDKIDNYLVFYTGHADYRSGTCITSSCDNNSIITYPLYYRSFDQTNYFSFIYSNSAMSFSNIDDLSIIHSNKDVFNINDEIVKRADLFFSESNNSLEHEEIFSPSEICYTDENSTSCTSDIIIKNSSDTITYTGTNINGLYHTGSTDPLPKSIDFKFSKVPLEDLGSSVTFNFHIYSFWATSEELNFSGTLKIGNNSYTCEKTTYTNSYTFSCTVFNSFNSSDSMILHLDYETFPLNESYDVHIDQFFRYRYIVDTVSPPDEPSDDENLSFWDRILNFPKSIVNGFLDGLKSLFVPSNEEMELLISDFKTTITEKLGFVGQSLDVFITFFEEIFSDSSSKTCLEFPTIEIPYNNTTYTLYNGSCVSFVPEGLEFLQDIVKIVTSITFTLLFLNMCRSKLDSFLSGGDE